MYKIFFNRVYALYAPNGKHFLIIYVHLCFPVTGYSPEMFLAVQHALSQSIIKQKLGKPVNTKVYLQRFPQLSYRDDKLLIALEKFISMIIMLCFAYTFVNTVRVVTAEKELQLKVNYIAEF